MQCGADALEEDPLARLSLSNNAYWAALRRSCPWRPGSSLSAAAATTPIRWLAAGPASGRPSTSFPIPETLPEEAKTVLRRLVYNRAAGRHPPEHWTTTLRDAPREGPVRADIRRIAAVTLQED